MALHITDACTGCGACRGICPTHAASGSSGSPHAIDSRLCIECGACGRVCPADAVADIFGTPVVRLPRGEWMIPFFIAAACKACEACVQCCPAGVLAMEEQGGRRTPVLTLPKGCVSCTWCVTSCMFGAVEMRRKGADTQ